MLLAGVRVISIGDPSKSHYGGSGSLKKVNVFALYFFSFCFN